VNSLAPYVGILVDWSVWHERGDGFVILRYFADAAALIHPEDGMRGAKLWLQANAARIRVLVVGIATVVPATFLKSPGG
jgi:hypothetical protein